jgi:hypothetical protein
MDDRAFLTILFVLAVIAFAYGIWAGLGYPGLYEKYEKTGRASRLSPFEMLMNRLFRRFDR